MTTHSAPATDELAEDRRIAEELQDRLLREQQTATALREYLLKKRD
jgi:hypothetical protein